MRAYLAAWLLLCLLAVVAGFRARRRLRLFTPAYGRFLRQPWKLATFAIAFMGMVAVGPYTVDPTWDYFDASFMSLLAYATAPWVTGVLFDGVRRRAHWAELFVALCVWMFSVSWSYDLYILWRDGAYPATWLPNIPASSVLYFSAGLFWNLEWQPGRGVIFGFMREGWPEPLPGHHFSRVFWFALPFMLLVGASVAYFIRWA